VEIIAATNLRTDPKGQARAAEHLAMALTLERVGSHLDVVGDDQFEQRAFDRLTQLARQLLGRP
jgi:hypothetical protein